MSVTQMQAAQLATFLNGLRPEWPVPTVMSVIGRNRDFAPFPELAETAVRAANDPNATPTTIFATRKHTHTHGKHRSKDMPKKAKNPKPKSWDIDEYLSSNFRSCFAEGPKVTAADDKANVWTDWEKGVGVRFYFDGFDRQKFTLEEVIEMRDALSGLIKKVEKAVKK